VHAALQKLLVYVEKYVDNNQVDRLWADLSARCFAVSRLDLSSYAVCLFGGHRDAAHAE
jgi:hypothetical protein